MAKTARRKAERLPAASSTGEAIQLLTRYAELDAQLDARKARVDAAIASLKAQADELDAPAIAEQKQIFLKLKPWWAVSGADIAGERKTWELGGCLIGHRTSNPALGHPTPERVAVALLKSQGWWGLLRIKTELDKPAIVTAIRMLEHAPPEDNEALDWLKAQGFSIVQKEEFFIDRLPPKGEATEVVVDPAAAQAQQVAA
jgi:hypothetical protein